MSLEADVQYTEPLVWTPSQIKQLAVNMHNVILAFNDDVARAVTAKQVPAAELTAWRTYRNEWSKWFSETSLGTWMWSGNVSVIEGYGNRLNAWADKYRKWTGREPSGTGPYNIKGPLDGPWFWLGVGAVGAAGLYLFLDRRPRA